MSVDAGGDRASRPAGHWTRWSPTGVLIEPYHDGHEVDETASMWALVGSGAGVTADRGCEPSRRTP